MLILRAENTAHSSFKLWVPQRWNLALTGMSYILIRDLEFKLAWSETEIQENK